MRRTLAAILCGTLLSGCATAGGARFQVGGQASRVQPDPKLLASFVKELPIGSRVQVDLADGHKVKGTLMKATDASIVVQPRTRVPEAPVEITLDRILAVQLDNGNSVGRTFGIAIAAGAAGTLAVFLILAAIFAGD